MTVTRHKLEDVVLNRRDGSPFQPQVQRKRFRRQSVAQRLENYIMPEPNTGCWLWTGPVDHNGYGFININYHHVRAHRAVYEVLGGKTIPIGLSLDHLCRQPSCVNPDHLEPVTHQENMARSRGKEGRRSGYYLAIRTHCKNGHEFTPENTHHRPGQKARRCRMCERIHTHKENQRRAALRLREHQQ